MLGVTSKATLMGVSPLSSKPARAVSLLGSREIEPPLNASVTVTSASAKASAVFTSNTAAAGCSISERSMVTVSGVSVPCPIKASAALLLIWAVTSPVFSFTVTGMFTASAASPTVPGTYTVGVGEGVGEGVGVGAGVGVWSEIESEVESVSVVWVGVWVGAGVGVGVGTGTGVGAGVGVGVGTGMGAGIGASVTMIVRVLPSA